MWRTALINTYYQGLPKLAEKDDEKNTWKRKDLNKHHVRGFPPDGRPLLVVVASSRLLHIWNKMRIGSPPHWDSLGGGPRFFPEMPGLSSLFDPFCLPVKILTNVRFVSDRCVFLQHVLLLGYKEHPLEILHSFVMHLKSLFTLERLAEIMGGGSC